MMGFPRLATSLPVLGMAGFIMGACSSFLPSNEPPPPCPPIAVVKEASKMTRFQGSPDPQNALFKAEIAETQSSCVYRDNLIVTSLQVVINTAKGPGNKDNKANFSYFIAIGHNGENVAARENFDVAVSFEETSQGRVIEEIEPEIPFTAPENGDNYVIYVGLQLNRAELEYNRNSGGQ